MNEPGFDPTLEDKNPDKFGCYEVTTEDGQTFLLKRKDGKWIFFGNEHIEVAPHIKKQANKLFGK